MSVLKSHGSRALAAATLGFCLLLAGCGSKLNKENFDKVKVGQTQADVEAILGAGTVANNSAGVGGLNVNLGKTETWQDGDKQITVVYDKDGKVTAPPIQKGL